MSSSKSFSFLKKVFSFFNYHPDINEHHKPMLYEQPNLSSTNDRSDISDSHDQTTMSLTKYRCGFVGSYEQPLWSS